MDKNVVLEQLQHQHSIRDLGGLDGQMQRRDLLWLCARQAVPACRSDSRCERGYLNRKPSFLARQGPLNSRNGTCCVKETRPRAGSDGSSGLLMIRRPQASGPSCCGAVPSTNSVYPRKLGLQTHGRGWLSTLGIYGSAAAKDSDRLVTSMPVSLSMICNWKAELPLASFVAGACKRAAMAVVSANLMMSWLRIVHSPGTRSSNLP